MRMSELEYAAYLRRQGRAPTSAAAAAQQQADAVLAEAGLLEHLRALARRHGWLCYHTHDSRRSEPGFPDLVLCRPPSAHGAGRLLFAELKNAYAKMTMEQQHWLDILRHSVAGVEVYLWRPQDLAQIETLLTDAVPVSTKKEPT